MPPIRSSPLTALLSASLLAASLLASTASAQVVHDPSYSLTVELTGLANPQGIDVDAAGNVYIADSARGQILKGSGGSYSPIITGIAVSDFFGLDLGPIGIHIGPDQSLWYGEGGRFTGDEQIHHHTLDGSLIQSLAPVPDGGNWSGITTDPVSGRLYASSSNGDRIFISDPTGGGAYGPLTEFINTGASTLISPTGLLLDGDTLFAGFYGPFTVDGQIATYSASTGALINAAFATAIPGMTDLDRLADGRLLAAQFGNQDDQLGVLWSIDPVTGEKTALVTDLSAATGVAVADDGTTIYLVDMGLMGEQNGRVLKLTVVPGPGSVLCLTSSLLLVHCRRRM